MKIPSVLENTLNRFKEALEITTNLKSLESAEVCKRIHATTTTREYLDLKTSSNFCGFCCFILSRMVPIVWSSVA
jgi:hypothetical protein